MSEPRIDALKAIAHAVRFSILSELSGGARNVGEIEEGSGVTQPLLSQQLAVLRQAGLVQTRREAKQVYYSLNNDALSELSLAIEGLKEKPETQVPPKQDYDPIGAATFARMIT